MAVCTISIEEWQALNPVGPIVGVDEAGRGAWAGPLIVAAAAFLDNAPSEVIASMKDSKKLSPQRRLALVEDVCRWCVCVGAASYSDQIDANGLAWEASRAAFAAIRKMHEYYGRTPITIVLDGQESNWSRLAALLEREGTDSYYFLVRADQHVKQVSAASILAKVVHDQVMSGLDAFWPQWGFAQHQGYGTPAHLAALEEHGISPIHRRSYRPLWRWVPVQERLEYRAKRWRGN